MQELARGLTGWTVARVNGRGRRAGQAFFDPNRHQPGVRNLLGRRYPDGADQAGAMLDDLAVHPATARHVASKLARHFVADEPEAGAVAALERVFLETSGDLAALARAVVELDAAWTPGLRKFKTPDELIISAARMLGDELVSDRAGRRFYQALGQPTFQAPSPAGWPDDAAYWAGPDAIRKRLEWSNAVARRRARRASPMDFLAQALGPLARPATRTAVSRAESVEQALTLALMSPEFQRR